MLGACIGLLLMTAFFVVRFIMDDKIKTAEEITKYIGIPTLAIVPALGSQKKPPAKPKGRQGR